ncbi:hypothetical protein ZHAS_00004517 [Anopheles sinensis]|uniref:Uncharacterized protein n=1 Tax=Anopheles sinensis TaxID=74873 RepID=A0A084VH55_ANOSI|nr:hypothetical protein ZHAS_00004517 [Anopheles sinensis]
MAKLYAPENISPVPSAEGGAGAMHAAEGVVHRKHRCSSLLFPVFTEGTHPTVPDATSTMCNIYESQSAVTTSPNGSGGPREAHPARKGQE